MVKEASSIPPDMSRAVEDEINRGVDPAELARIGYHVPGRTDLRYEDAARVMVEGRDTADLSSVGDAESANSDIPNDSKGNTMLFDADTEARGGRDSRLSDDHIDDPELDAMWQEQRRRGLSPNVGGVATSTSTSKAKNARAAGEETAHMRRTRHQRQTNRY